MGSWGGGGLEIEEGSEGLRDGGGCICARVWMQRTGRDGVRSAGHY